MSVYWPLIVLCVFVCVISNQSTSKKTHYVSDLSKLDALLHKRVIPCQFKKFKRSPQLTPQTLVIFGYYVHLYKMRKSWKFQVNILSGLEVMLFEGGKLRGTWLQGLPNLKFPSISRVNDLFSNLDRALTFSKSKELQKMHKKYSKWVFQNFQKIHNGGLKIEKKP